MTSPVRPSVESWSDQKPVTSPFFSSFRVLVYKTIEHPPPPPHQKKKKKSTKILKKIKC